MVTDPIKQPTVVITTDEASAEIVGNAIRHAMSIGLDKPMYSTEKAALEDLIELICLARVYVIQAPDPATIVKVVPKQPK